MTDQGSNIVPYNNVRKGQMTSSACGQCRRRKVKCSGDRPACVKCLSKQESCEYDIEEGSTRLHDLRARLSYACEELALLKYFVDSLKFSSDADAALLLARLRLGDSIVQVESSRLARFSKAKGPDHVHFFGIAVEHATFDNFDTRSSPFSVPTNGIPTARCENLKVEAKSEDQRRHCKGNEVNCSPMRGAQF
ncbi:hypothetical protein E2P81_ATG10618 [Venturia nashicola]|nr:hypothetical protein E2P81_ATG10618 [Venturia nashicola]